MNSLLNFFSSSSSKVNLVDYLKETIDQAKKNSSSEEFTLVLNFKDRFGNEDGTKYLAQTLQQCQNISRLHLELRDDRIPDEKMIILLEQIQTMKNLKHLSLSLGHNYLKEASVKRIGQTIGNLTQLESINLKFDSIQIGQQTVAALTEGFNKCQNLTNLNLNLDYCNIQDSGLQTLCDGLARCINLTQLNLSLGCNGFSQYPNQMISQMIGEGPYLEYLKSLEETLKKHKLTNFTANYW
ncbi:kinase domain protein (macronuclear) [Tetrahymena thermophila SB210]|uniref:Kinase domain protein n=1 Tax=Tetrahymena thermophila (strain SB210) TaxID=312017 RepID=Q24G85_TETTS|nr:kinase domain protein [Tetrahymena thermophila SB210]EAS06845.1 kinase domain protein [Tetrahymena thermophila SB210]|eukprot:XP_001027087.1 kinase domain protein [Tetrahymena thermophila SB210]